MWRCAFLFLLTYTVFPLVNCIHFRKKVFSKWLVKEKEKLALIPLNTPRHPSIIAIVTASNAKHAAFHAWPEWLADHLHPPIMAVLIIPHTQELFRTELLMSSHQGGHCSTLLVWRAVQGIVSFNGEDVQEFPRWPTNISSISKKQNKTKKICESTPTPSTFRPCSPHPPSASPFPPAPFFPVWSLMQHTALSGAEVAQLPNNYPTVL